MNDLVILHLSDLHIDGNGKIYSKVHRALLNDIKNQTSKLQDNSLVIAVTGDIINKGCKSALENAKKFFCDLKACTEGKVIAVYIVPGNHDKSRTPANKVLIPSYRRLLNTDGEKLFDGSFRDCLWKLQDETYKESGYYELLDYIYKSIFNFPDMYNIAKKTYGVHILNISGRKYCFILLNTAWSCIDEKDTRKLILGQFQLNEIASQMRDVIESYDSDSPVMTIVMGHHPIECLTGTEQDSLFSNMVSYNSMCANIYLCGHTHDRKVINWSNNRHTMHTLMTGIGWPEDPSDHIHEHFYSIYEFNLDLNSMDIYVRRTNDDSGFIPDLSIYTGSATHGSDKLVRPIHFEEARGAIQLSSAENVSPKVVYTSSSFLEYNILFQTKLHEISFDTADIIESYKNELYEGLVPDGIECGDENIDDILLTYLNDQDAQQSPRNDDIVGTIMKKNSRIIYENFWGFIQRLCQIFYRAYGEDIEEGQIVRFHFRYLSDKNTMMYSTLCSSFTSYNESERQENRPSDIKYGDLLEAAFKNSASGTLIFSVNKDICKTKLKDKWKDFITVVPKFEKNIYRRKMNKQTVKKFPFITFGITINDASQAQRLQCMDYYHIDQYLGNILQKYIDLFMLDIDEFISWLKEQNR